MKVLLAEDEPDIRLITSLALEDAGCTVVAVADGQAAVEAAMNEGFDVALLDVMMPRMDGFATCTALRSHAETSALPIIFLTARSQEPEVQHGLALGAAGYIVKPFDVFTLVELMTSILEQYQQ
ncbi:response regulator [Candidatus Chloroploca sp. M-50]|uniref:Response regulator n=1 Tax=Candidatus Chloroploca mongolica TaxID=2528176 RepID=A0ABS4DDC7_9CHLR|nr:response regulator [Candidatus Chloroploca mongolica]MBP1467441.1 response regulator [Candidatus Chloroploca mongolica]